MAQAVTARSSAGNNLNSPQYSYLLRWHDFVKTLKRAEDICVIMPLVDQIKTALTERKITSEEADELTTKVGPWVHEWNVRLKGAEYQRALHEYRKNPLKRRCDDALKPETLTPRILLVHKATRIIQTHIDKPDEEITYEQLFRCVTALNVLQRKDDIALADQMEEKLIQLDVLWALAQKEKAGKLELADIDKLREMVRDWKNSILAYELTEEHRNAMRTLDATSIERRKQQSAPLAEGPATG